MRGRKPRAADASVVWGSDAVRPGHVGRIRVWMVVAVVVAVGGIAAAVASAGAVAASSAARSREGFKQASTEVASTLQLAVQREQDLVVSASGFVIGNPNASNSQFVAWANSIHALTRYPELVGFGHSVIVPAAQLAAFAARATRDPVGPLAANGTFKVVPAGKRAFYCFAAGGVMRDPKLAFPAGFDYCASGPGGRRLCPFEILGKVRIRRSGPGRARCCRSSRRCTATGSRQQPWSVAARHSWVGSGWTCCRRLFWHAHCKAIAVPP